MSNYMDNILDSIRKSVESGDYSSLVDLILSTAKDVFIVADVSARELAGVIVVQEAGEDMFVFNTVTGVATRQRRNKVVEAVEMPLSFAMELNEAVFSIWRNGSD